MCAGSWGDCLGLKAQPSLELFLNLGLWESGSHQKIMRKSESVGLTLQCSVPPRLDNALGSPCWKWFKTESWTNLKGSEHKNHSGLGLWTGLCERRGEPSQLSVRIVLSDPHACLSGDFKVTATEIFPHHVSVVQEGESRTSVSEVECLSGALMIEWSQFGMRNPALWHFVCFQYVVVTLVFSVSPG